MEPSAPGPDLYLIQLEMGGTAGPYDLGQIRELLELDRASPHDRLVHVGTRQGLKMTELVPDAAEIHRKRKSDRLRRRSDRLAAVQPAIPKAHDLPIGTPAPAAPAQPVDPAAPIDLPQARPSAAAADGRSRRLTAIAAVAAILIVIGSFAWDFVAEYFRRISPHEIIGTWQIELSQMETVPPEMMMSEAKVTALRNQLKELKLTFTPDQVIPAGRQGEAGSGWKIQAVEGEFMVITFAKPIPPLGDSTTFVRIPGGLGLVTPLGLATLRKQP